MPSVLCRSLSCITPQYLNAEGHRTTYSSAIYDLLIALMASKLNTSPPNHHLEKPSVVYVEIRIESKLLSHSVVSQLWYIVNNVTLSLRYAMHLLLLSCTLMIRSEPASNSRNNFEYSPHAYFSSGTLPIDQIISLAHQFIINASGTPYSIPYWPLLPYAPMLICMAFSNRCIKLVRSSF